MIIEKASMEDHDTLTEITKQSKAYWGYSEEQIRIWTEVLTITAAYIETNHVFKLVADDKIAGYYSYFIIDNNIIKLDNLFMHPGFIGKGLGKLLMLHFFNEVKQSDAKMIRLDAEPRTETFYEKFGFVTTGKLESSIQDRFLPVMELKIT